MPKVSLYFLCAAILIGYGFYACKYLFLALGTVFTLMAISDIIQHKK